VPTRKGQRELIAKETEIPPGAALCDLGCGDGTVLFDIARRRPDIRAVGYDISLFPLLIGWVRKFAGANGTATSRSGSRPLPRDISGAT